MNLLGRIRSNGIRIFFATDLHGSTLTFRKFLSAPTFYGADVLVLGGDLTGKRIIRSDTAARSANCEGEEQIDGSYVVEPLSSLLAEAAADPGAERELFVRLAVDRLEAWLRRAETVLDKTRTPCFVIAGNDDPPEIAETLNRHPGPWLRCCEERVLELGDGLSIGGFGWSNPTPWRTPREATELELEQPLRRLLDSVDPERLVLDVHVPPYRVLDVCPELDTSVDPPRPIVRGGQVAMASVGSTTFRELVVERQPLLALCGHVHEARGAAKLGQTLVVNPGSEYNEGVLRGALIKVRPGRSLGYQLTSG